MPSRYAPVRFAMISRRPLGPRTVLGADHERWQRDRETFRNLALRSLDFERWRARQWAALGGDSTTSEEKARVVASLLTCGGGS